MESLLHRRGSLHANGAPQSRDAIERRFRRAAIAGGLVVGMVGLVVLVGGWWLNIAVLRQPLPSSVAMRAGTALGLLTAGVGVVSAGLRWPRLVTGGCGALTTAIGVVACATYILGGPKSLIESALAIDIGGDLAVPGRIAANTALCLLLLGCGLILLALDRASGVRQALAVAVLSVAYVAVIGYLTAGLLPTGQYGPQATPMAPLTAVALIVASFSLLFVSLERGWGRVFAEPLAGGQALRTALPVALVVFGVFAGILGALSPRGYEWETAVLAVFAVVMICGLILLVLPMQRIDAERAGLATDIEHRIAAGGLDPEQANVLLRAQFDGAPTGVVLVGAGWKSLDANRAFRDMLGRERKDLLGADLVDFVVHPDDRERARSFFAEHEAGGEDRHSVDVRVVHRDGRVMMARLSVGVVRDERDERDEPLVRICSFEDITAEVAARNSLAESERRYRLVADSASDAVTLIDLTGVIQWASPSFGRLFGYDPQSLVGRDATTLASPMDLPTVQDARVRASLGESEVAFEVRFLCADGNYRWVAGKTGPARDATGAIVGRITSFRDAQEHVDTRAALGRTEHLLRRVIDGAPQGMAIVGLDLRFVEVNDALRNLLGRGEAWFLTHTITDVMHPDEVEADLFERQKLQDGQSERFVGERRWLRADGTSIRVIHSKALLRDNRGSPLCYVSHVQDNTAAHVRRDELIARLSHDPLTGLINRDEMLEHVSHLLGRSAELGTTPGLLFCDIDFFKTVNDTLGHATGDEVLRVTARRIASALRGDDVASRLGGDEFVVVLDNIPDRAAALHVAERIRRAVSEPLPITDSSRLATITMSVGIALAAPGVSAARLLRNADAALYQAKRSGRDRTAVMDGTGTAGAETDRGDGLALGEFVPLFQPIASLADGRLTGYEALARRILPDESVSTPCAFLQDAAKSSLMPDVDMVVMDRALDDLRRLPAPLHLAVNVRPATLALNEYAQLVVGRLEASGVDPSRLHLELNESALRGATGSVRAAICDLAEFGVRWYVDDFGTGHSSVSDLRDLPLAGVKLDESFTAGIRSGDARAEKLGQAFALLADCLGLDTVAAGVQTQEQAEILRAQGWRHGQGPLYGLPTLTPVVPG